jgi:DNA-binding transcriptional MerR regulator
MFARCARIFARRVVDPARSASYDSLRHIGVISSVSVTGVHSPVGIEGVTTMAEQGFSGKRTAEIVDITYRQLDYWARTDLVKPSLAQATGSGSRRQYSYRDLLELKVIKSLLDAGIRLEQVRKVFTYMREQLGEDVASANLVIDGSNSVLVNTGEELIDLLQNGQGVLNVLPLAGVKEEVDARIVSLYPEIADEVITQRAVGAN